MRSRTAVVHSAARSVFSSSALANLLSSSRLASYVSTEGKWSVRDPPPKRAPLTTAAPLAPPPPPRSAAAQARLNGAAGALDAVAPAANVSSVSRGYRTPPEVLEMLLPYIPTYWVYADAVMDLMDPDIKDMIKSSAPNFQTYIRKYRFYFDHRTSHNRCEVRLRPDLAHPRKGIADVKHSAGVSSSDIHRTVNSQTAVGGAAAAAAAPSSQRQQGGGANGISHHAPRNSLDNLMMMLVSQLRSSTTFTPLPDFLKAATPVIVKHPAYDQRLGVMGLLERHPQYFQIVDGSVRVRPFLCAPYALAEHNELSSPLPDILAHVLKQIPAVSEADASSSIPATAAVETAILWESLNDEARTRIRETCKSLPRFLRLHGRLCVVSTDNMHVRRFVPEAYPCADHLLNTKLTADSIHPDDPILKIPVHFNPPTAASSGTSTVSSLGAGHKGSDSDSDVAAEPASHWAIRELYDALPLMQAVTLQDLLVLVPSGVRHALPPSVTELRSTLEAFPDYFACWAFPDDEATIIVQRAKLPTSDLNDDAILRALLPCIPQGGVDADRLLRRVPLPLQRYFYKHGLKTSLKRFHQYVLVVGDKVMRIG